MARKKHSTFATACYRVLKSELATVCQDAFQRIAEERNLA